MAKTRTDFSENEWRILEAVWAHEPCTAPAIQEILQSEKNWAYTTVKTLMDRMVKKGLLRAEKVRTLYFYRAAVTVRQAKKREVSRTLKRAFDGALTPMMQFLLEEESVSDQELDQLEQLIQARRRKRKKLKKKR